MFKRLIRGFVALLKAELLLWLIILVFAGIVYMITSI